MKDEVLELYNRYGLVSGDVGGGQTAWGLIDLIEQDHPVDEIKLKDGTRLWNLIRIFLYSFYQEQTGKRRVDKLGFVFEVPVGLMVHQLLHRYVEIEGKDVLEDVIDFICTGIPGRYLDDPYDSSEKDRLVKSLYSYITVFADMKQYYLRRLMRSYPVEVRIGCGYGRLPMARAQACRELGIRCIEVQHGFIGMYHPAYRSMRVTSNHDGVPEYLECYDGQSAELVRGGHLFDPEKVFVVGYPVVEQYVLFTGQWLFKDETIQFLNMVACLLPASFILCFKPHPLDHNEYHELDKRIRVCWKHEDINFLMRMTDVHATVCSGSIKEAQMFGKPTVYVDVLQLVKPSDVIVQTPEEFVKAVNNIFKLKEG